MKIVILGLDGCIARHFIGMTQMLLASSRVITKDTVPGMFRGLDGERGREAFCGRPRAFFRRGCGYFVDFELRRGAVARFCVPSTRRADARGASGRSGVVDSPAPRTGKLDRRVLDGVFMLEATGMLGRRCGSRILSAAKCRGEVLLHGGRRDADRVDRGKWGDRRERLVVLGRFDALRSGR